MFTCRRPTRASRAKLVTGTLMHKHAQQNLPIGTVTVVMCDMATGNVVEACTRDMATGDVVEACTQGPTLSTHIHVDVGDVVVVTRMPARRVPGVVNTGGVPFIIPHTHTHAHTRTHTHAHTHAHTHTHTHTH
jgi:thiamine biosynthesis protein ThiC